MIRLVPFAYHGRGMNQGAAAGARTRWPILWAASLVPLVGFASMVLPGLGGQNSTTSPTERANQLVRAGRTEAAVQLLQTTLSHPAR